MAFTTNATIATFGGKLLKLTHEAASTGCKMNVNLFLPPQATSGGKVPVLIFLSGLTCTENNAAEKGLLQARASQRGLALVFPDTSPRGLGIAGEDDAYDFGSGAGFYVDATADPWADKYRMYTYVNDELQKTLFDSFKELDAARVFITGHSMGGHGALTLFLKNPGKYRSVSAFSPISNPLKCPWGQKAFKGYFGEVIWEAKGAEHDATELIKNYKGAFPALIDVGTGDNFYKDGQLLPENLVAAAKEAGLDKDLTLRLQDGYDHR